MVDVDTLVAEQTRLESNHKKINDQRDDLTLKIKASRKAIPEVQAYGRV